MVFIQQKDNYVKLRFDLDKDAIDLGLKVSCNYLKNKNYENFYLDFETDSLEDIFDANDNILKELRKKRKSEFDSYKKNRVKKIAINSSFIAIGGLAGYFLGDSLSDDNYVVGTLTLIGSLLGSSFQLSNNYANKEVIAFYDEEIKIHKFLEDKLVNHTTNGIINNYKEMYKK